MKLRYIRLSPTGNITVLVLDPVPRALHGAAAAQLLNPDIVGGEQVGYMEKPADPRADAGLRMMGGEFCGNASMSLGAVIARQRGLKDGERLDLLLEVSGSSALVPCRIERRGEAWEGTVDMPLPEAVEAIRLSLEEGVMTLPLVRMPGIAHLLLPAGVRIPEARLREYLPRWNRLVGADALGCLSWDAQARSIDPLVYVPSAGTLVREHGCGSGTAAVGCWLATEGRRSVSADIAQSGGVIRVEARYGEGRIEALTITGQIVLCGEGVAEIEI